MSSKKFLSKALNAVSAIALSGVLLGPGFITSAQAMLKDDTEYYKNHPASHPIQGLAINEKLPDEVLFPILKFAATKGVPQNTIAILSTHFFALIYDPLLKRTMLINSPQRLQEILAATLTPVE